MKRTLILFMLFLIIASAFAEENSAPKALKAATLSVVTPGGGQFYNGKYLKSGVVLILEGSLIGLSIYNISKSNEWYDKYEISGLSSDFVKYNEYYDRQQNYLFWFGAVVLVSAIDAFVDAHLADYELKKDKIHLKFENNAMVLSLGF